jgi:uncharacterized protein YqgV (UPF0045/DUF77 family)
MEARDRKGSTLWPVHHLEFTIEPFVEGRPGPHVVAAVEAVRALGVGADFGPFGTSCQCEAALMPDVVAAITRAAFENGASHLSLHIDGQAATLADEASTS